MFITFYLYLLFRRHHGSLGARSSGSPTPLISPFSHLFLHLPLSASPLPFILSFLPLTTTQSLLTSWQGRKVPTSGAPWTSSAWRASFREERAACWWLTAGPFLSTTRHTCKVRSMSATPSWWRGDCSRTRSLSPSCCSPMAKWRWVKAAQQLMPQIRNLLGKWVDNIHGKFKLVDEGEAAEI